MCGWTGCERNGSTVSKTEAPKESRIRELMCDINTLYSPNMMFYIKICIVSLNPCSYPSKYIISNQ